MNDKLTLRDHFAGLAMQAIMATVKLELNYSTIAAMAYNQADAMLEVRERYATAPKYSMPDDVSKSGLGT